LPGKMLTGALIEAIEDLAARVECPTILIDLHNAGVTPMHRALMMDMGFDTLPSDRFMIARRPPVCAAG
jgi:hypothetical protein